MNTITRNKKVIPFRKEGSALLEEIQRRIQSCRGDGSYDWANIYEKSYNEVLNYVNSGSIPPGGFSQGLAFAVDLFKRPVQEANDFWLPMPKGSLEAFYAICTSSTHTSSIRSKADHNDPVSFARALPEPFSRGWYSYCRFQYYVIERGESLNLPFKFTKSNDQTLIIGKDFNFDKAVRKLCTTIIDMYKGLTTSINISYSKNLRLDIFVLDNDLSFQSCINTARDHLNGVSLSKDRQIIIEEVLHGSTNEEWHIPNYRITISDNKDLVECYLILRFIPLPSFVEMITHRAGSLHRSLTLIPQHVSDFPNRLINSLRNDLQIVCDYRSELRDISDEIDLSKYEHLINQGRIPGYIRYNTKMNWNVIPKNIFTAVYELLETYNHYQTLGDSITELPEKIDIPDDLQEHILRSLQNFGRDTSNYLKEKTTKDQFFKSEVEITTKLVTYLDNHKMYIVHSESKEGAGRLDIKIEYKYNDLEPLMIEGKLFKIPKGKTNLTDSAIHGIFESAVRQIEDYTAHSNSVGMLLFFTLDLNEGEIAQIIGKKSSTNGFLKIPKSLQKNKITHRVKKNDVVYPIRFMKLSSKPPSKG